MPTGTARTTAPAARNRPSAPHRLQPRPPHPPRVEHLRPREGRRGEGQHGQRQQSHHRQAQDQKPRRLAAAIACRMPKKMNTSPIATHVATEITAAAPATFTKRRQNPRQRMPRPWPSHRLSPARNRNDPAVSQRQHPPAPRHRRPRRDPAEKLQVVDEMEHRHRQQRPARARSTARTRPGAGRRCCGTRLRSCAFPNSRSAGFSHAKRADVMRPLPCRDCTAPSCPDDHGRPHRPADRRPRALAGGGRARRGSRGPCSTGFSAMTARWRWPKPSRRARPRR
jgi:hypothetical protein